MTSTTAHRPIPCPACGAELSVITGTGEPSPGSVSICAYCRVYLVVITDGYRVLRNAEWFALEAGQRAYLAAVRERLPRLEAPHA